MGRSSWISDGFQWVNRLLPLEGGNREEKIWTFDYHAAAYHAAAKMFKTATDTLGLSGMTTGTKVTVEPATTGCAVSELCKMPRRGYWKAFSSVTRHDKSSRLAVDCRFPARPLRNKLGTLGRRGEELFMTRLHIYQLTNA